MRRALGSLLAIGLLSSFLLVVVLGLMLVTGTLSLAVAIGVVVVFNGVMLLVGPFLNDLTYRWLYDMEWLTPAELRERSPESADVVERVTAEYGYDHPKFGYIDDLNPTAFTYGSGRFNARVVLSEGCFEYLSDEEVASVVAHELGHVTSRDFIVMTLANTVVEILYLVAVRASRVAARSGTVGRQSTGKGGKAGNLVAGLYVVAALAYVLHFVGEYAVLYLSRVREYAADRFAAEWTSPDALSNALVAISYGIVDSDGDPELAKATKNIGIMNVSAAKETGIVYMNLLGREDRDPLLRSFLFDLENPWAKLLELSSTHPLTGKRVERLSAMPGAEAFDFAVIRERFPVDRGRLYREFGRDVAYLFLPLGLGVFYPLVYLTVVLATGASLSLFWLGGGWLVAVGVAMLAKTYYRYPGGDAEETTVIELLGDVSASPVRGRRVELDGELVGRGTAGYRFSEDLMFRDESGLLYLKYDSWLPLLGNFLFAVRRVPKLVGQEVTVSGWFLRGRSPWLGLRTLRTGDDEISSYVNLGSLVAGGLLVVLGVAVVGLQFVV